jgi:HPt (histidine-containing phosphotransfer) domain-containing protein
LQVAQLRDEVGSEDFEEVLDLFFEETEEVTARLANQVAPQELRKDLHFLKGSALNLGFAALSQTCHNGEVLCEAGNAAKVDLTEILAIYSGSKKAFLEALPSAFSSDIQTSL